MTLQLNGKRFGKLTVVLKAGTDKYGKALWACVCDCGETIITRGSRLTGGAAKSCGCTRKEFQKTRRNSPERQRTKMVWDGMKSRCLNSHHAGWKSYGGRGITVCDRWRKSFDAFIEDMGFAPVGLTLERKDNNAGYSKENCRWATHKDQSNNTRTNVFYEIHGIIKTAAQWISELGISKHTFTTAFRECRLPHGHDSLNPNPRATFDHQPTTP